MSEVTKLQKDQIFLCNFLLMTKLIIFVIILLGLFFHIFQEFCQVGRSDVKIETTLDVASAY